MENKEAKLSCRLSPNTYGIFMMCAVLITMFSWTMMDNEGILIHFRHTSNTTGVSGIRSKGNTARKEIFQTDKNVSVGACGGYAKDRILRNARYTILAKRSTLTEWPKYLKNYKNPCWFDTAETEKGIRCLPHCYILGVAKSGTTSLYEQLVNHPDIAEPDRKEGRWMQQKTLPFEGYLQTYRNASRKIYRHTDAHGYHRMVTLDANPLLFTSANRAWPQNKTHPKCTMADALYAINPGAKLVVTLRNPTIRLFSHYRQCYEPAVRKRMVSGEYFHRHTLRAIRRMGNCLANRSIRSCLFDKELYLWQLREKILLHAGMYHPYAVEWLSVFPRSQILFVKAEELYSDATTVMQEVFKFLDLSPAPANVLHSITTEMKNLVLKESNLESRNLSYRGKMWHETRTLLDEFYSPYNVELSKLLGHDKWLFKD